MQETERVSSIGTLGVRLLTLRGGTGWNSIASPTSGNSAGPRVRVGRTFRSNLKPNSHAGQMIRTRLYKFALLVFVGILVAASACPTAPAGSAVVAAVFGSSSFEQASAQSVLSAALSADSASSPAVPLFTSASWWFHEVATQRVGAAGVISSGLASFLANALACNVSFVVSTSCGTASIQLFLGQNATGSNSRPPLVLHAAVCTAWQAPAQLAAAATAATTGFLCVSLFRYCTSGDIYLS